ncbi:MAG: efflux RND transporter periplasmic adaptor subunit [Betaproteobacteria bacterium]|nr:efflux RND transporter periplasmic adaptor subunit [Betaproteobacteria bacterium]
MAEHDLSKLKLSRGADGMLATKRRPWRRFVVPVLLIAAAIAGGGYAMRAMRDAPVAVEQATVTTAYPYQAFAALTATGYVVAQRKAAVASKATGRLEWLGVAEGSRVRKGEVIARLESSDVAATRDQAAASLKVTRANVEQSRVELDEARRELARAAELLRQKFVSESVYDQARARVDKAAAGLRSLEASVAVAQANLRAAEVSVEQTLIRAPFDGVVLTKSANVGDVVTPFSSAMDAKGAVVSMADMSTLEVEADVSESSLAKVRLEQPVEIELDALPDRRFRGVVSRMVPTVDRSKATVMTKIRFVDIDPRVLPEMSAKAIFLTQPVTDAQREPRTAVNPAAVVKRDGRDVAFVVEDGTARRRDVRRGQKVGDLVEIADGLAPGDKVVLNPADKLADGNKVKPAAK